MHAWVLDPRFYDIRIGHKDFGSMEYLRLSLLHEIKIHQILTCAKFCQKSFKGSKLRQKTCRNTNNNNKHSKNKSFALAKDGFICQAQSQ